MSSSALMVSYRETLLPWSGSGEDDRRFKRVLQNVLFLCALGIWVVWLSPPVVMDRKTQEIPEQLATMVLDHVKPLPPPEVTPEKPADLPKAAEKNVEVNPADVHYKQQPAPEARVPQANKPPGEIDAARRKVAGVGLLSMAKDLEELRGAPTAVQIAPVKPGPGVGTGTGVGVGAGNEAGVPVRSMITSNASGGSGGINTAGYSSNTGGGGLAGRSTTLVPGAVGGGGGGGAGRAGGAGTQAGAQSSNPVIQHGKSGKASRSIEDIKLVFEKNKGAIYAIYYRALREDPGLQGKVILELKIAPAGNVIDCRVVSSELNSPELENKLLARIRQFDFGAKDVDEIDIKWPIDFLPS